MSAVWSLRAVVGSATLLSLASLISIACTESLAANHGTFQAGMNVLIYKNEIGEGAEREERFAVLMKRLEANSVNSLNLAWPIYTDGVRSNRVFSGKETPSMGDIRYLGAAAVARGFEVVFRPILDEQALMAEGRDEWRGTIRPRNVASWFASYSNVLLQYARIAEDIGAHGFSIGTELTSMEQHTTAWRDLIASLRREFGGYLIYSSNRNVSAHIPWADLDYIGVDAYFESTSAASLDEMSQEWRKWQTMIGAAVSKIGRPLILTEIGSTSQENAHRRGWIWDHGTPVDLENQRLFYESACNVWKNHVRGIYWWVTPLKLLDDPLTDQTFVPIGKPAEEQIRLCFSLPDGGREFRDEQTSTSAESEGTEQGG